MLVVQSDTSSVHTVNRSISVSDTGSIERYRADRDF